MVKVEIEIPDGIAEFLKDHGEPDLKKYAEESVQHGFGSDWNCFENHPETFIDMNALIDKYNLTSTEILQGYIKKVKVDP